MTGWNDKSDMTDSTVPPASLSAQTLATAREVLAGKRSGLRASLAFAGPAVVASIAYMDPGNFATNIQAGAKYGYGLLWVVLLANVIAMLFQGLSAKLGIVTGKNLAEMCRDHFPRPVVLAMWVVSEIAAMATDLAEFLGGAIGLSLLLHMPLLAGMVVTAIVTYGLLMFEGYGFRPLELIIGAIVGVICLCYLLEMFIAPVDWASAAYHLVTPQIADAEALLLAVGIIGATVMPHAIYLHSGLTQARVPVRNDADRRKVLRFSNREVVDRAGRRRPGQHRHGDDGLERVSRRPSRSRRDRNRLSHADAAARRRGVRNLPDVADRVRHIGLDGRHHGGPDDHAGLCRLPHSDLAAPAGDHGAGLRRGRARRQRHQRAGHQSGDLEHRAAVADDRARHLHRPARHHGRIHQQPPHPHRGFVGTAVVLALNVVLIAQTLL